MPMEPLLDEAQRFLLTGWPALREVLRRSSEGRLPLGWMPESHPGRLAGRAVLVVPLAVGDRMVALGRDFDPSVGPLVEALLPGLKQGRPFTLRATLAQRLLDTGLPVRVYTWNTVVPVAPLEVRDPDGRLYDPAYDLYVKACDHITTLLTQQRLRPEAPAGWQVLDLGEPLREAHRLRFWTPKAVLVGAGKAPPELALGGQLMKARANARPMLASVPGPKGTWMCLGVWSGAEAHAFLLDGATTDAAAAQINSHFDRG